METRPLLSEPCRLASQNPVVSAFRRKIITVTVAQQPEGRRDRQRHAAGAGGMARRAGDRAGHVRARGRRDDGEVHALAARDAWPAGELAVKAIVTGNGGDRPIAGYQVVEYPHIHRRHVVQAAAARVKVMDVTIAPGLKVGYIMGVGDKVPEAIEQLGATVTLIDRRDAGLGRPVVVRRDRRSASAPTSGGRTCGPTTSGCSSTPKTAGPSSSSTSGPSSTRRNTDRFRRKRAPTASPTRTRPIEILTPDHPVFNRPNRIGPETWRGWVQERGTYFMGQRDPRYVDLLRSQDPFPYNAASEDRRAGGGARRQGPVDLYRARPLAAAAGRHGRRLPSAGQPAEPGKKTA